MDRERGLFDTAVRPDVPAGNTTDSRFQYVGQRSTRSVAIVDSSFFRLGTHAYPEVLCCDNSPIMSRSEWCVDGLAGCVVIYAD